MNIKKSIILSVLTTCLLSVTVTAKESIKRISGIDDGTVYTTSTRGVIYFDKPITTGANVSKNIAKFKKFDIKNAISDDFYGGYIQFEHNFYLLPMIKTEMSTYSFEKLSKNYEKNVNGDYVPIDYYSQMDTEEQNYMLYWELLQGHDMQLNVGGQYKIIKGHLKNENLTTHSGTTDSEVTFEKYLPMVYIRGDAQFAKGIELTNELSIGIDKEETVFENNFNLNYYTKIGLIGVVGYKYKHQEFIIENIKFTNNTHSLIVGMGYQY